LRILHVTPHLPPDQAANALLPVHLGRWAVESGDTVTYIAHPPRARGAAPLPGNVEWIARSRNGEVVGRIPKIGAARAAIELLRRGTALIEGADIVHLHSNGVLTEVAAAIAQRHRKPVVLTLYGTEIWHYQAKRIGPDLFTRAYRQAAHVTFYSQGLMHYAQQLGLARRDSSVVYPPVADEFTLNDARQQEHERTAMGLLNRHLLVNVKRLHPLGGHRTLIDAMNEVIRTHPDTRLIICGTGPLLGELEAAARAAGVEGHVTFAGLVDNRTVARYCAAADLFVLPSLLEACPTVALEALACGTPVVGCENPGALELNDLFGMDVAVVPQGQPLALARTIVEFLSHKRRTLPSTQDVLGKTFRKRAVWSQFERIYERARDRGVPA
jgi:glycosyltransferase involved in cell wall biosynthesis